MKINVRNSPDRKFIPYVKQAIEFYGSELMSKRILSDLEITIKFKTKMEHWATAEIDDADIESKRPRKFVIEIHPWIGVKNIFETLAHEMVHVKQFAKQEIGNDMIYWKGDLVNVDKVDYYKLPWEFEAYGYEIGLCTKFITNNKLWNIFEDIKEPSIPQEKVEIKWKM